MRDTLDNFEKLVNNASKNILSLLRRMILESSFGKYLIYAKILQATRALRSQGRQLARDMVYEIFNTSDGNTLDELAKITDTVVRTIEGLVLPEVEALIIEFSQEIDKAVLSVEQLTDKFYRVSFNDKLSIINANNTIESGIVNVIGQGGKTYRFALDYYFNLLLQSYKMRANAMAVKLRSLENNSDLVIVSGQPSLTGDYCNAYRGKVFSLSGEDRRYPPLASTPRGGPPFHPWCRHTLSVFDPSGFTANELEAKGHVPEVYLKNDNKSVAKAWWANDKPV
jgi:hypothetical protein